jgi:uncharacterized membrane protein YjjP (DUF1212 family)
MQKDATAPRPVVKQPLHREELRDVIDLALWAGQLLLQYGAETDRVEETVHRLGTGLGCNWMDILVSPNAIIATTISGDEFRTKTRRVVAMGINMTILTEINHLSHEVSAGYIDRYQARRELERIGKAHPVYNRWVVVIAVGVACAAFSRLLGGDAGAFLVTLLAAALAMFVRQELARRHVNSLLIVIVTAFVAGVMGSAAAIFNLSDEPQIALAASVLLLVPGVPLINCAEDLIKGHLVTGIVRGITGGLVSLCIALGLLLALRLTGVSGL